MKYLYKLFMKKSTMQKVRSAIMFRWKDSSCLERKSWDNFFDTYLPCICDPGTNQMRNLSVAEFMKSKGIRNVAPLRRYLAVMNTVYRTGSTGVPLEPAVGKLLDYPNGSLAGTAYSVSCVSNDFDKQKNLPSRYEGYGNALTEDRMKSFDNGEGLK